MNKVLIFVIVVLLFSLAVQKDGCNRPVLKADTVTKRDTSWLTHDSLILKKLVIKKTIHDTLPKEYIADTNYPKLKAQYEALVNAHLAKNIYSDTVKLDTLGYVSVTDTVHKNELHGRSYKYSYKIPTITVTNTITKQAPPKGALFVGGGVTSAKEVSIYGLHGAILYKTPQDRILGLNIGILHTNQVIYGFSAYWKIK